MGGKFSVIKIENNNQCYYLKNDFSGNDFDTFCDFLKAYNCNKIAFTYTSKRNKAILDSLAKVQWKLSKCY